MIKPLSLIAVILCGLGIALYFYEQAAEQGQENLSGQILLKQLDTKNLNKIQVRSSEGLLELHQSQQGWQETGLDYPLSGEKIQEFLLELTDLRPGDLVTDNPERHALFQLLSPPEFKEQWEDEKHAVAVSLLRGDYSSLLEILLGKSREQGSGQYLRYADSDEVYLLPDTLDIDTDPNDWLNKELTSLDEKMIQKLDFQNSSDSDFTLSYDNQSNSWSMSDSSELMTLPLPISTGFSSSSMAELIPPPLGYLTAAGPLCIKAVVSNFLASFSSEGTATIMFGMHLRYARS